MYNGILSPLSLYLNYLRVKCRYNALLLLNSCLFPKNGDIFPHNHSIHIKIRALPVKQYYYLIYRPSLKAAYCLALAGLAP